MSFVKKYREFNDYSIEIEYLNKIKYTDPLGYGISKYHDTIIDEQNDCFLISASSTNPNRDNVNLSYYVLCVKGVPITITVSEDHKGNAASCSAEFNWNIKAIDYPKDFNINDYKKIKEWITAVKFHLWTKKSLYRR